MRTNFFNISSANIRSKVRYDFLKSKLHALLNSGTAIFISSHYVRIAGDWLQVINPMTVATIAYKERQFRHFGFIFGLSQLLSHLLRLFCNVNHFSFAMRPGSLSFSGMPSGHTNAAFVAAAYTRTFLGKYHALTLCLYGMAIITAISRVVSRKHSLIQVFVAIAIAELIVYLEKAFGRRYDNSFSLYCVKILCFALALGILLERLFFRPYAVLQLIISIIIALIGYLMQSYSKR